MKSRSGFTIVEVIVAITIIAILASVTTVVFNKAQADARDAARNSSATIISEALERYYEKNGEYPSVASLTNEHTANTGSAVAAKLGIPPTVLTTPAMPSSMTNPIISNPETPGDYIAYTAQSADNDSECQNDSSGGCDQYTLQYSEESTGSNRFIESRHRSRPTVPRPDLELSVTSITSIGASWSAMQDATSYELQRSPSSNLSAAVTTTHTTTSASATSLSPETEYFFRVRAIFPGMIGEWSDIQSATTSSLGAPIGTITITAAMSGTNARGTAGGGTCSSGTIERQIRYQINTGAWQAYATGTTRDIAATEGYRYTFQAQARCVSGSANGPWSHSSTAAVVRAVTAPSGPTITAAMSGTNARGTAGGGSCAAGTTIERQIRHQVNTGAWSAYTAGTTRDIAATSGYQYTFQQQARCVGTNASSGWAASSTASIVRPVAAPSSLTIGASMSGTNARGTAGGGSCAAGTTIERQIRYNGTNSLTAGAWSSYTTGTPRDIAANQGYKYTFQQQARCVGTYISSGWVASGTSSVVRPVTTVPARLASISISTVGSTTTWTVAANTSCPTGTTAMYSYRYITSPIGQYPISWQPGHPVAGEPAHNWNVPGSTSRTMSWNTSARNTRYNVDFQTYCMTVHSSGGWPAIGRGDHYERL